VPFYLYEFEARSGYAIPLAVIERLRDRAPNLAGMKVSDSPWERLEPYLVEGLDVFVGAEALLVDGLGLSRRDVRRLRDVAAALRDRRHARRRAAAAAPRRRAAAAAR
jgi:hypothetical protein